MARSTISGALRANLERDGVAFRTESDTEVLLALYRRDGDRMVNQLRGMFAFAVWDAQRAAMLLARDPYGIKPLYFADDGWTVRVASQVKALLAGGRVSRQQEPAGRVGFALFGSVPEPFTTYQEIRAVPSGTLMWVDESGPQRERRHYSIAQQYAQPGTQTEDSRIGFIDAVRDSVRAHLVADVPVGAFLSAGIDSGALVGAMSDLSPTPVRAVTIAFDAYANSDDDEAPLAALTAARYGVAHTVRRVDEAEFRADLPRILEAMDQPSIDGFNTWFAAKAAREQGLKVAVSGVGGDELVGGYESFRDVPRWVRQFRALSRVPLLGSVSRTLLAPLLARQDRISPKAAGMLELGGTWAGAYLLRRGIYMPWELSRVLPRDTVIEGLRRLDWRAGLNSMLDPRPESEAARVACLEAQQYLRNQLLRDTDWAGMAHSLEVRTPLIDAQLLRRAGAQAVHGGGAHGKAMLAQVPSNPLPAVVIDRRKTGFQTPVAQWLSHAVATNATATAVDRGHWSRRLVANLTAIGSAS